MLRVIGAGFGRTGTYSLKTALEQLGFGPTYHMAEVFQHPEHVPVWQAAGDGQRVDWDALFAGYQSAVDWPASAFYRDLMGQYPDARVILTVRDPERWYQSGRDTIFPSGARATEEDISPEMRAHRHMADTILWNGIFHGQVLDRAHAIDIFTRHIETVRETVDPNRLLVYEVSQGWEPLCAFLGVPVPDGLEFPHLNDTESFQQRRDIQRGS
ncbi:MAG TPA: sulfotransferase [Chloroflexota bacterium]|nr:sulfotransferase [Chloroflexota bacterium]